MKSVECLPGSVHSFYQTDLTTSDGKIIRCGKCSYELTMKKPSEEALSRLRELIASGAVQVDAAYLGDELKDMTEDLNRTRSTVEVRQTSSSGGQKGQKTARFDLIDPSFLWGLAEVCGLGAMKYSDDNWRKGYDWGLTIGALERHLGLLKTGEVYDRETGLHHAAMVAWHAMVLFVFTSDEKYAEFVKYWPELPTNSPPEFSDAVKRYSE